MSRKVDLGMARKFLVTLAPDAVEFTFQLFSDSDALKVQREITSVGDAEAYKRGGSVKRKFKLYDPHARIISQTLDNAAKTLAEKNTLGVGVFVTVNETTGRGRTLADFSKARALWADMDGAPTPKWPIKPTMIVETSPGKRHFYWVLDDDIPLETWRGCMRRIVETHGADKNAADPVRVLRLPGFFHCKKKYKLVRLLKCNGKRYTAAELVKAFPPIKRNAKNRSSVPIGGTTVDVGALRSALAHLVGIPHPRSKHSETYADDYETWINFGLAIKRGLGDDGFSVWDEWARTHSRYDKAKSQDKWDSFNVDDREGDDAITVGTIFACAKRHGWSFAEFRIKNAFETGLTALKAERGLA
jgi:Primase C terminal 2 (PriCT-2)/RepB DNA-primase N-terminal domain